MTGKDYYELALLLTDRHRKRFCDMMAEDFLRSRAEREYFRGDYCGCSLLMLELDGWATFTKKLIDSGEQNWLSKIESLDESIMLNVLEKRLLDALSGQLRDGTDERVIDKDALDGAVKAIQGLVGRSKILGEQRASSAEQKPIEIHFSGVDVNPITGKVLAGTPKTNDIDLLAEPAEQEKQKDDDGDC